MFATVLAAGLLLLAEPPPAAPPANPPAAAAKPAMTKVCVSHKTDDSMVPHKVCHMEPVKAVEAAAKPDGKTASE
jgi:hypothetical protein